MDELEKILKENKTKSFLVVEPGGDNGDRLIYMGMYKKLNELGINYEVLRYKEKTRANLRRLYFLAPWRRMCRVANRLNKSLEVSLKRIERKLFEITIESDKVQTNSSDVILIHGGGNINDLWGNGLRLLKNVIRHNPNCIIIAAPQTYWFDSTLFSWLFRKAKQEIYFFVVRGIVTNC
ncbi:MAG: polysaccharide pyruvyl transferase family protein [Candidatus Aenigmatarchaeota archaeon]